MPPPPPPPTLPYSGQTTYNRALVLLAVSGGQAKVAFGNSWQPVINGGGVLSSTVPVIRSAINQGKIFFADGTNWTYYDPATNTIYTWVPTAGQLPVDSFGGLPRLIATWRGRTVLSGLPSDPYNWFMSAVGDPFNWDYSPLSTSPAQAIAGNVTPQGKVPDVVTALIPYTDDIMILGGDHTLYMFQGDPAAGGQITLVSNTIGVAWGIAWCMDPFGTVYFMSNLMGIYTLVPGQQPVRISQRIESLLNQVQIDTVVIRLLWDDAMQGMHVFITPFAGAAAATHFFYEARTGAWWEDTYPNNLNPMCCLAFQGNTAADRVALIGSWDGFVRASQATATSDDGTAIASSIVLGPILTDNMDDMLLKDLQALFSTGTAAAAITWQVYVGQTPEDALSRPPVASGTWGGGLNFTDSARRSGHAIYLKLTASSPWAMEKIRARIQSQGKVRKRGR